MSLFLVLACGKDNSSTPTPSTPTTPTANPPTITGVTPMTGSVGTKVVITGTAFSATTANNNIKFGSTEATVDSATTTRLVTKVPQGAQSGKISVTVSGTTVSSTSDFVIMTTPTVTTPTFGTAINNQTTSGITSSTARAVSVLNQLGDQAISQHGHVWSKGTQTPTLASNTGKTELGSLASSVAVPYSVSSALTGLDAATNYTIRAYLTTASGTTYGPTFTFTTLTATTTTATTCILSSITQRVTYTGDSYTATISYDAQGRVSKITYSSGTVLTFSYATSGELVSVEEKLGSSLNKYVFTYSGGKLTEYSYNNAVYKVSLNASGQIVTIQPTSGDIAESKLSYDSQGNLTSLVETLKAGGETRTDLTYDDKKLAFASVALSEAHKIVLTSNFFNVTAIGSNLGLFGKNNPLTTKISPKNSAGVVGTITTRTDTYIYKDGFPTSSVMSLNGNQVGSTSFTTSNCK
ncbi:IPT/TIG domain-containing protein [Spirosoma endbachense]|nr:IPT/TIG domain-containing protein [Spirosoma endbachense]